MTATTTAATGSSAAGSSNQSPANDTNTLVNAYRAYLNPLLKKHGNGDCLVYDDLSTSWKATQTVLEAAKAEPDTLKNLQSFHHSQIKAYENAGKKSLADFAYNYSMPSVADGESESNYITRVFKEIPDWKLKPQIIETLCRIPLRKRASEEYQNQQETEDDNDEPVEGDDDEEEDGEIEDGEEVEAVTTVPVAIPKDDETDITTADSKKEPATPNKSNRARSNARRLQQHQQQGQGQGQKHAPAKKKTVAKNTNAARQQQNKNIRGGKRSTRGRRGGRGGQAK